MVVQHRRRMWLLTRWAERRRQAALDAAEATQQEERQAARRRLLEMATMPLPTVRPGATPADPRPCRTLPTGHAVSAGPHPVGPEPAQRNRRIMAERLHWPPGALENCERIEAEAPGWVDLVDRLPWTGSAADSGRR